MRVKKEREEKDKIISEMKTKLHKGGQVVLKGQWRHEENQENHQENENWDKAIKWVREEVNEMKDRQRRLSIIGVPAQENQSNETERVFQTIIQESFLGIKEDLALHISHTRENWPRMINFETYPNKIRFWKLWKSPQGLQAKKMN